MKKLAALLGTKSLSFLTGFAAASALLIGCASFPFFHSDPKFPFKYYGLSATSYAGTLKGPTPADDLPLTDCQPTGSNLGTCFCMKSDAMFALKQNYITLQDQLNDAQKPKAP